MTVSTRTALVCGGSGRIGSSIATALAARGDRVAVHCRRGADRAAAVVKTIESAGGDAFTVQADLTDEESVSELVQALERKGGLHILVSAVHGQFTPRPVADMDWDDWFVHLDALKAHFLICRHVLPSMREQAYGRIVYISAGLSERLFAGCSAYSTIKAGLNAFCKTMAIEEGQYGITVNIVAPGKVVPTDGRESTDNPEDWETLNRRSMSRAPLGRHATAEDVANAVLHFTSRQASGVTGQTLFVAGGEIMP